MQITGLEGSQCNMEALFTRNGWASCVQALQNLKLYLDIAP
jgi:hypothetical protein